MLIWGLLKDPSFFMFCFAVPFWAAWLAVFGILMGIFFGRTRVRLDEDGLFHELRVLIRRTSRRVPLGEIRYFHAVTKKGEESASHLVEAVTDGQAVSFSAVDFQEAEWLAYEMNGMLEVLKRLGSCRLGSRRRPGDGEAPRDDHSVALRRRDDGGYLVRGELPEEAETVIPWNSRPRRVEPPSDCRWKIKADVDSAVFEKRGEFSLGALAGITFLMFFWNGGVSVFVLMLCGIGEVRNAPEFLSGQWWFLFVFLIPFEVIGIGLFLAWFSALFAPFGGKRWSVSRDAAIYRVHMFGFGWRWRYSLENCREMVIEPRGGGTGSHGELYPGQVTGEKGEMKISFVDFEDKKLCEIKDVTAGEARWMADNVLWYR